MIIKSVLFLLWIVPISLCSNPHIVFIIADDMGWNDFSFHGADQIQTPNIDALAYHGVILNQLYAQPVCTPTRAALLTGRYPSNIGMQGWPLGSAETKALPAGKILPEYLKDLGYSTYMVGKWHLGYYKEEFTPTYRGFDSHLGYLNGFISYFDHINQEQVAYDPDMFLAGLDFRRNMTPAWDLSGRYATDVFTEEAERLIQQHNASTPMFLYLAHLAGHAGNAGKLLEAPQEVINQFSHIIEPNRKTYAAMTWNLDESVGRVVKALQANGMLENTVIVFMSDNGAPTESVVKYQNWGSNYPLRGLKTTHWEGGIRVPAVIWNHQLARRVSGELFHVTDWLPTLLAVAGGSAVDAPVDGLNQWDALMSNGTSPRTDALLLLDEVANVYAFRWGKWKLTNGTNHELQGKTDGFYGESGSSPSNPPYNITAVIHSYVGEALSNLESSIPPSEEEILEMRLEATVSCPELSDETACNPISNSEPCLFDLVEDPCEKNNVASSHPDVVQTMMEMLSKYQESLVPQEQVDPDIDGSDPAKYNNTWSPWKD
ncbi:arylsulfatase B-like isoform X1 [Periplaneta americana]|uniref:arylsulfatase B-like isoform X1 n=1 Tax=Periplaneta americana TaxID=6978 RepID=UPI0037E95AB8